MSAGPSIGVFINDDNQYVFEHSSRLAGRLVVPPEVAPRLWTEPDNPVDWRLVIRPSRTATRLIRLTASEAIQAAQMSDYGLIWIKSGRAS